MRGVPSGDNYDFFKYDHFIPSTQSMSQFLWVSWDQENTEEHTSTSKS